MWGDLRAPALRTTESVSKVKISPPLSASMPTAWEFSIKIRLTKTLPLTVRLRQWRIGYRWVMAVLILMPSRLFMGPSVP